MHPSIHPSIYPSPHLTSPHLLPQATDRPQPENGPRPRARLVVIHGFSDHVGRYYGFFPYLAGRGVAVYGLDQRGWGRSVRRAADRGRTGPTARVLADMAAFIRDRLSADSESDSDSGAVAGAGAAAGDAPPPPPLFVLGHSMGGGQALTLACTAEYDDLVGGAFWGLFYLFSLPTYLPTFVPILPYLPTYLSIYLSIRSIYLSVSPSLSSSPA